MTLHKLSAGDGYTYLTRQVASADRARAAGQSLADYYVAHGNPPGVWMGKGAEQLGVAGGEVSEAQMRALFGAGLHPDADAMRAAGATEAAVRLGARYPSYAELAPYPDRVAARVAQFVEQAGREPSQSERGRLAANEARRGRRAVAGFDLVFTPVKSASVLWALGGPAVRAEVEAAHHEAVASTIGWLEEHAAYTRTGHGGVAQIDASGLVCAAFDHRESRSGDPDLHTHVAIANKVCGMDGKWRSLDARGLYGLGVAASERYNTRFEDAMARRLGVRFVERPGDAGGKRPVREIDGVPADLIGHFSRRRALIEQRYAELRSQYRSAHGREPNRPTQLRLAQQATLETREAKGVGRSLAEQVTDWTTQARTVVGRRRLEHLAAECVHRDDPVTALSDELTAAAAKRVVRSVATQRATWTIWNLYAETERALRPLRFADAQAREQAVRSVVEQASGPRLSIRIAEPELVGEEPALVRASDNQSVFVAHGSQRYTSSEILSAEDALVTAATSASGPHVEDVVVEAALAMHESSCGIRLDPGQRTLVEEFAATSRQLAVGIGPAGAGKTTAMRAFAEVWGAADLGRVIPLASSSRAAAVLGAELGMRAENLHKFLHENTHAEGGDGWFRVSRGDVLLVDEAGMAGTLQLAELLGVASAAGAAVRLLGDPAQLAAVDAGGALRLLEAEAGAAHLSDLHRFTDPDEGSATLALRSGCREALDFYFDRDRVRSGARDAMLEAAYDAWAADVRAGRTSVLVASTNSDVTALNARARLERVDARQVASKGVGLRDGNTAGVGDWVITRQNARLLRYARDRWVHNGDSWRVVRRHRDGALTVRNLANRHAVVLPAAYVSDSVELAYASTAHRVQGTTTDTAHALVTTEMTREALYVASTRGRHHTALYVATENAVGLACDDEPDPPRTAREVLDAVLARSSGEDSATATIAGTVTAAGSLPTLISRYEHARTVAADDALRLAVETLPEAERPRILGDRAAPFLARVLAEAAGRGVAPQRLLRAAYDLEDLDNARSPALVLATRIQDHPRSLGAPDRDAGQRPLPWLPAPDVGHPGWLPYLRERAGLIRDRAEQLGSLAAVYREQYDVTATQQGPLGEPPEPGTRREDAYRAALAEIEASPPAPPRPTAPPLAARPAPVRAPSATQPYRGPRLTR
ncbi:MobF family relaxase [Nocardioides terrisoli]|uniref:MobF family relaxase n=1 Tax=Nocardioides terrisoli TaxID=3388267 RepID=UPI00287B95A7|nr:MobF family relaxase [Nocardioides marmorisolisilvae]